MQLYRCVKCIDENFILKQKINVICLRRLHHLRRCLLRRHRHSCYCSQRSSRSGRVREDEKNKIVIKQNRENRIQAYKQINNNDNGNKTKKSTLMCCCRHRYCVYRLLKVAVLKRTTTTATSAAAVEILKQKKFVFGRCKVG